jgi:hypothetical protein
MTGAKAVIMRYVTVTFSEERLKINERNGAVA